MNLEPLFQMQKELDAHIEQQHPREEGEDRLAKKILALQVELGELANEWRGFKFWSNNQAPRTHKRVTCHACKGHGEFNYPVYHGMHHVDDKTEVCTYCEGTGIQEECNPLLEEYVDCLHFILSIGLEKSFNDDDLLQFGSMKTNGLITQFTYLFEKIGDFRSVANYNNYQFIVLLFIGLGEMLGFTWEEIEKAYKSKNGTNHQRQVEGY